MLRVDNLKSTKMAKKNQPRVYYIYLRPKVNDIDIFPQLYILTVTQTNHTQ
jgi:hypothetical protein